MFLLFVAVVIVVIKLQPVFHFISIKKKTKKKYLKRNNNNNTIVKFTTTKVRTNVSYISMYIKNKNHVKVKEIRGILNITFIFGC